MRHPPGQILQSLEMQKDDVSLFQAGALLIVRRFFYHFFSPANQFAQFDVQSERYHEKSFNVGRAHFPFKVADALLGKARADSKLGQGKFEFFSALLNHQGKSMAERRAFFL